MPTTTTPTLHPHQSDALRAFQAHARTSLESAVIEAATGYGKTHLISAIATWLTEEAAPGKRVLVLAPRGRLVSQDAETHRKRGGVCSVYCADLREKCTARPVIFGTPGSVAGGIKRGDFPLSDYSALLFDDFDGLTPTISGIMGALKAQNPRLRVLELTGTPFRLGDGYVYRIDSTGAVLPEELAKDPPFARCIYSMSAAPLIGMGFLVPPVIGVHAEEDYDTSGLRMGADHKFTRSSVAATFAGKGRKTERIIQEVIKNTADSTGVLIFAASVEHALQEIMPCLPSHLSACIIGDMKKAEREAIYSRIDAGEIKYFVTVEVATRGFDCPRFQDAVFLRATESRALWEQMLGRVLRLSPGKAEARIWDYAGNIARHSGDEGQAQAGTGQVQAGGNNGQAQAGTGQAQASGNNEQSQVPEYSGLFRRNIRAAYSDGDGIFVEHSCPRCRNINVSRLSKDATREGTDGEGYMLDLAGKRIPAPWAAIGGDNGDAATVYMPAVMRRRCGAFLTRKTAAGHVLEQCAHRWNSKACPECEAENDIAARKCKGCGAELVNPNDKLTEAPGGIAGKKAAPIITERLLSFRAHPEYLNGKKTKVMRVDLQTESRKFPAYFVIADGWMGDKHRAWLAASDGGTRCPAAVRYRMPEHSGMLFSVVGFAEK
jgi:DNA repair protein RadD